MIFTFPDLGKSKEHVACTPSCYVVYQHNKAIIVIHLLAILICSMASIVVSHNNVRGVNTVFRLCPSAYCDEQNE